MYQIYIHVKTEKSRIPLWALIPHWSFAEKADAELKADALRREGLTVEVRK